MRNFTLMGAIIGDICGSSFEKQFDVDVDLTEGLPKGSQFTDDTVCTIAVADWLLHTDHSKHELIRIIKEWVNEYPYAGYGKDFYTWAMGDRSDPYESYGNGSAMRVSPVGLYFGDKDLYERGGHETIKYANLSSEITHNHPEAMEGCEAIAYATYMAKVGASKIDIMKMITGQYCLVELNGGAHHAAYSRKMQDCYCKFDNTATGTVPLAFMSFNDSESYIDCIEKAISFGGDTDTIACMAGGIAAAYYKDIPDDLYNECFNMLPSEMQDIVMEFDEYINN